MRIAFSGASGSGKTTLAKEIAEAHNIPLNPIGSRSTALSMGFGNPYDVDRADATKYEGWLQDHPNDLDGAAEYSLTDYPESRRTVRGLFQHTLQAEKIAWEERHIEFVTDRSILDDLAYCILHDHKAVDKVYMERALRHLELYDVIFFTPLESFYSHGGDACRVNELMYHELFEVILRGLFDFARIEHRVHKVPKKDRSGFVAGVITRLDSLHSWR